MKQSVRWFVFLATLLFSLSGFAAAVIETATGQVRAGADAKAATAASAGQRVETGSVVLTGAKSLATLRFDDGHVAILHENTEFRVVEYSYVKDEPAKDRESVAHVALPHPGRTWSVPDDTFPPAGGLWPRRGAAA